MSRGRIGGADALVESCAFASRDAPPRLRVGIEKLEFFLAHPLSYVMRSSRRRVHYAHAVRAHKRTAGRLVEKLGRKKRLVGELPTDQRNRAGINCRVVDSVTKPASE